MPAQKGHSQPSHMTGQQLQAHHRAGYGVAPPSSQGVSLLGQRANDIHSPGSPGVQAAYSQSLGDKVLRR